MPLNELTLAELTALMHRLATIVSAGNALQAGGLGPVFDLTPGAPISIYTNAVMPGIEEGVTLTPLAADIVTRTSARDLTRCGPELSAQLRKEAVDYASILFPEATEAESPTVIDCAGITTAEVADRIGDRAFERDIGIDTEIPSFLKRESTEAPSVAPDAEPVDPPPALGEVAGGGPVSAESSRPAEADDVPQDAAETGAEVESGGGGEAAAPEAPAATDANAKPENWTPTEDQFLIRLVVQGIMGDGLSRKAAIVAAARSIGRPEPGTLWRVAKKLKAQLDDALTAAAFEQAKTEIPEIPPAEVAVTSVSRDAAAGGHSPAAVQPAPSAPDPAPEQAPAHAEGLRGDDLMVWQWITAHRAKWPHTAGTDLDLAVGLGRGEKLNLIALDIGIDVKKLRERWDCLSRPIRNGQDKITLDGMPRLIKILRRIAKAPAAAA